MPQSLTWSDLHLTAGEKAALEPFALSDPQSVVALARTDPDLLKGILPNATVERIKVVDWRMPSVSMRDFALGVPLSEPDPAQAPRTGPTFEDERETLLKALEVAVTPQARDETLEKLQRLYGSSERLTG